MSMPVPGGYRAVMTMADRSRCLAASFLMTTPIYDDTDRPRCKHCGEPILPMDYYCAGCNCQLDYDAVVK